MNGETDKVILVHNGYVNKIVQEVKVNTLLPLKIEELHSKDDILDIEPKNDEEKVLEELIQKYVEFSQFFALLDSLAAEHSARMQAMDAATNNASDKVKELTLQYNKVRQEAVTTELIEIISGMESLKK
jgi:F-type H+-transporting ATPase subunit gamma